MAGRYDRNPFDEEEEVNPFAIVEIDLLGKDFTFLADLLVLACLLKVSVDLRRIKLKDGGARGKATGQSKFSGGSFFSTTGSVPPVTNSRLSPLPPEPADFYNPTAPVDIPLDSASDLKKKERELQAKEAELKRREQEVRRKEEAAARAGIVLEEKNWPPFFPIIHHDIANEIPIHLQKLQYVAFTTFLGLVFALLWNVIAVTTAWIKQGGFCIFAAVAPPIVFRGKSLAGILPAVDLIGDHVLVGIFYFIGFGIFCLESVLSIWVIQQVYMYFRGSGKAAEMKREAARGAMRAAF
ncbi:hypothetical protein DH2020_008969 [Rehmannia glutinosa]|uniref:Secretory carrier-associated membrane protein n=1 Tax=Rehmannia glutinosa TaxID=99300 RepID=A0ABR0X678_REHGL